MRKQGRGLAGVGLRTDQEGSARQGIHALRDEGKSREQKLKEPGRQLGSGSPKLGDLRASLGIQ